MNFSMRRIHGTSLKFVTILSHSVKNLSSIKKEEDSGYNPAKTNYHPLDDAVWKHADK